LAFLISISGRQEVAKINNFPVYVVTEIALIPLSSRGDAETAICEAKKHLKNGPNAQEATDSDSDLSDDGGSNHTGVEAQETDHASNPSTRSSTEDVRSSAPKRNSSNVAEDVIGRKGQYGRFAERWFSRKGWTNERIKVQGMSADNAPKSSASSAQAPETKEIAHSGTQVPKADDNNRSQEPARSGPKAANLLLPKLLRTTQILLASRSFYFSYELDITRRLGSEGFPKNSDLPLYRTVDPTVSGAFGILYILKMID